MQTNRFNVGGVNRFNVEVTETTETGGVYVKEKPTSLGSWFLSREDLEKAGITDIKLGDRLSMELEGPTPCGGGFLRSLSRG